MFKLVFILNTWWQDRNCLVLYFLHHTLNPLHITYQHSLKALVLITLYPFKNCMEH